MIKSILIGTLCASLIAGAAAAQADTRIVQVQRNAGEPSPGASGELAAWDRLRRVFDQAAGAAQKGDYKNAYRRMSEVVSSADYDLVEKSLTARGATAPLAMMWLTLGLTGSMSDHPQEAKIALATASQFPDAPADVFVSRLQYALFRKDGPDAQATLTGLAARYGKSGLSPLTDSAISSTLNYVGALPDAAVRRQAVLKALLDADWSPKEGTIDGRWAVLAGRMIEQGDKARADAAVARITSAWTLLTMRLDKRFDGYVRADPAKFDIPAKMTAEIETARKARDASPTDLNKLNALTAILASFGRYEESLALADDAITRWNQNTGTPPFSDRTTLNWTYDNRARALRSLGRFDEALAAFSDGAKQPERGVINVSQALNLSDFYLQLGRWNEAVAQASQVQRGNTSVYGYLVGQRVLACAYDQLNDRAGRDKALKAVMDNSAGQASITASTLICLNDLDGAAKLMISMLEDPDQRLGALREVQTFPRSTGVLAPFAAVLKARERAVAARPDVQAVVERVGRFERQTIPQS